MSEVSIIVPVYNVEKYIRRCMDSLLAQTFENIEILLIDDGSKDSSGTICDEYALKDDRIKVIHKKNGGVSSARNVGLDNATGTYIMFCDADDYVESTWVEKLYNSIEKCGGFFACCGYSIVRLSGEIRQNIYIENDDLTINLKLKKLYSLELIYAIWNKIFAADVIRKNGVYFDVTINKAEDAIFALQYLQIKVDNIGIVHEPLYNYVFDRPQSLTKEETTEKWNLSYRYFNEVRKTMEMYGVSFSEYSETYYSNMIIAILQSLNTLFERNISKRELFARGKEILDSNECRDAFRNGCLVNVHPVYKVVLQTRCFFLVWLFHLIVKFKKYVVNKNTYAK